MDIYFDDFHFQESTTLQKLNISHNNFRERAGKLLSSAIGIYLFINKFHFIFEKCVLHDINRYWSIFILLNDWRSQELKQDAQGPLDAHITLAYE